MLPHHPTARPTFAIAALVAVWAAACSGEVTVLLPQATSSAGGAGATVVSSVGPSTVSSGTTTVAATTVSSTNTTTTSGTTTSTGGAGGGGGAPPVPLPIAYHDINHVLGTGQSLSIGVAGTPPLSTAQPLDNTMFVGGVDRVDALTAFVPLVEGVSPVQETMSSGLANHVSQAARDEVLLFQPPGERRHDILVTVHGRSATRYLGLKKGTEVYQNGLAQVTAARALAQAQNLSHVVRAVTTVHGESDHTALITTYEANLVEWQHDLETDIQAITGQTEPIPLIQSQISNWARLGGATSVIPGAQLAASEAHPDRIVLVGPKYALPYAADGVHLTNHGYRQMGELYAKAYRKAVLEGQTWSPLRPSAIARSGAVITVDFVVPVPPLVLDTTAVSNPGSFGFEFTDDSGAPPAIADVSITGPTTVTITLAAAPTGANPRLRYAFTGVDGVHAGPTTGPRGNLRDSDTTASLHGYDLSNWCVHFDKAIP